MGTRTAILSLALLALGGAGEASTVVDRIAVVVGRRAIKTSDIDRDIRVASFLNRQEADNRADAKRKVAERLIDQELVRQDMVSGQYPMPTEKDVTDFLQRLKRDRFRNSETEYRAALAKNRLTEEELRRHLLWQLTVLRFIDQRFRPAVLVTDEDVAAYRKEHAAELQKTYPRESGEALDKRVQEILTGERINQAFDEWLAESRRNTRIEFRPQAFGEGVSQ
jgi:hypothetical protein